MVKNPPANAGDIRMRVRSLGQEDPLEEGMATHSRILAWRVPWTEEPWHYITLHYITLHYITWWVTVQTVAKSRT